jgi:protein-S-isoprenylcysteine O-methyltransferase Ste14
MDDRIAAFVFRNRRFFSIAAFVVPMVLKFYLHGTTSLLLLIVGAIVAAVGIGFRVYSAGYLWGRHIVTEIESDFLCTSGPFAYIRNPLYLGNFVVGIGLCISLNEWYAYGIFLLEFVYLYSVIIPYEERFLEEKFGNAYAQYKARTGTFLPKRKGHQSGEKLLPNYRLGFASEVSYIIILVIAFAIFYFFFVK